MKLKISSLMLIRIVKMRGYTTNTEAFLSNFAKLILKKI